MSDKNKFTNKVVIYSSWFIAIGLPLGIFAWAYFDGQIKDSDQLFRWLGIIGVIIGGTFLQGYLTNKHEKFQDENFKEINKEEVKSIRIKWSIMTGVLMFLGLLLMVSQLSYEDQLNNIDDSGTIYLYSLAIIYFGYQLAKRYTPSNITFISPVTYWTVYFFIFIFYMFGLPMVFTNINLTDSDETLEVRKLKLINGSWSGLNEHRRFCYEIKHWETDEAFTSTTFCTKDYPRLSENDEVEAYIKKGDLGFVYVEKFVFPRLQSFETYVEFVKGEGNLRYSDIWLLDKLKGRNFHYHISKNWEDECKKKTPYKCRLSSYLYSIVKQKDKAIELLRKGCAYNEFTSCSGLYLYTPKKTAEKKEVTKKILKFCEDLSKLPEDSKTVCDWYKKQAKKVL